jgi:serine/threonine protein kinase/tetratricopeptide (TPR) repeat protein
MKCPKCQFDNTSDSKFCKECGTQLFLPEEISVSVTKTLETPIRRLAIGSLFAERYKILEELGKGGIGEVYKVKDQKLDEDMALKLLKPEITADKGNIERFKNELKLARKIAHRNVCKMHDFHEEEETPYITMEYVKGEDLKSFIRKKEKLKEDEALSIANQVCEGLAEAHELGVVHRDLKPQNIMMDENGQAKIMDFGIARSVEAPGMTQTGVIIGTPDYISPEQAEGQEADHRSDIYSLGVILYEMVTGTVPFKGDTALSVAIKHKTQLPSDPRKLNPEMSDDLSRLILICMEKERERRYQTAKDLLADLRNIQEGFPLGAKIRPRRETFIASLARKKIFIPALIMVLAVIAILIWKLLPQKEPIYPATIENSIAIISFENQTKDQISDDFQKMIPNLLITSLEETGLFYVATWERMRDLLKQIGEDDVDIITADLGFQACRREGIMALGQGSYAKVGEMIVIDIKILDVKTKQLLNTASSRGEGVESIINTQIDALSREIAQGMGIDKQTVKAASLNTSEVTTTSIEAYKYFLKGKEDLGKLYFEDARQSLEKAIILDPEFASAYLALGKAYRQLLLVEAGNEALEKAKTYSEKATKKERLFIEAAYARFIERDQEKRLRILEQMAKEYPKEKGVHFQLAEYYKSEQSYDKAIQEYNRAIELDPNYGLAMNQAAYQYMRLEDYEKAIEYFKRYASVSPGDANPLDSIGLCYFSLGRLDEAAAKFEEALEVKPDWMPSYLAVSYIYALKENYSAAMEWIDRLVAIAPSLSERSEGVLFKGFYYFWVGNFDQALREIRSASNLAESAGNNQVKSQADKIAGSVYYEKGENGLARKSWENLLDNSKNRIPIARLKVRESKYFGLADIKEGRIDSAKAQLAQMKSHLPELAPSRKDWFQNEYDSLHAEALLAEGSIEELIAYGKKLKARKISGGIRINNVIGANLPIFHDVLARGYRQKGEWDKAIAEYERLMTLDREGEDRRLIHPRYHYRLAALYEKKGWEGKAIEHYKKFLDLWKDADPSTPEIEDTKKKLAGLKRQ